MKHCSNCGNEIIAGAAFCGSCGTPQENNPSSCSKCGKEVEGNEKFCSGCGTPVTKITNEAVKTQPPAKSKEKKSTQKYNTPSSVTKPKKNRFLGCLKKTVLAIIAILIIGFVIIWNLPDNKKDDAINTKNNKELHNKVLGSWSVVDVATGEISNSGGGYTFDDDGTCYQEAESTKKEDRRKWRITEYGSLQIDFVEQSITYKISFEEDKMFFERYRPYYYYVRKDN